MTADHPQASSDGKRLARMPVEAFSRPGPYLGYPRFRGDRGIGTDERAGASGTGKEASLHSIGPAPRGTSTLGEQRLAPHAARASYPGATLFQARDTKPLPTDLIGYGKQSGALPQTTTRTERKGCAIFWKVQSSIPGKLC